MKWRLIVLGFWAAVLFASKAAHNEPGIAAGAVFLFVSFIALLAPRRR